MITSLEINEIQQRAKKDGARLYEEADLRFFKLIMKFTYVVVTLVAFPVHAQYASIETNVPPVISREQKLVAVQNSAIGKKFWITPNPKAVVRQNFYEVINEMGHPGSVAFVVTEPTSFTVSGYFHKYVKIVFQDGKEAFLKEGVYQRTNPNVDYLFEYIYIANKSIKPRINDLFEYILTSPPEEIIASERKQKSKADASAAAWKARGGVRIGMTASQARSSNWGAPLSINKSSNARTIREQWVYGERNYLYFENGILTSIQN